MHKRLLTAGLTTMLLLGAGQAGAYSEFQREFWKTYTRGKEADPDFRKLTRKAKCMLCHLDKDHKTNNRYGLALAELLGEEDKKDKDKIVEAILSVADQSSDPESEGSPTFGELIGEGKLPGGPLEEAEKEGESGAEG